MLWCFQNFNRKIFTVFKIKKIYYENHSKKKFFYKDKFLKKELCAGTFRQREHLLYRLIARKDRIVGLVTLHK